MRFLTVFLLFSAGLVAADTFLIKSVDAGRTWTDIDPGSPDRFLWWLQIDSRSSTLYALTQRDLGDEWHLSVSSGWWTDVADPAELPAGDLQDLGRCRAWHARHALLRV